MVVKDLRLFDIEIMALRDGEHQYEFPIENEFFEFYDYGPVMKGNGKSFVTLVKSSTLIEANIRIEGTVELICDRSLEPFDHPLGIDRRILFKFGETRERLLKAGKSGVYIRILAIIWQQIDSTIERHNKNTLQNNRDI